MWLVPFSFPERAQLAARSPVSSLSAKRGTGVRKHDECE